MKLQPLDHLAPTSSEHKHQTAQMQQTRMEFIDTNVAMIRESCSKRHPSPPGEPTKCDEGGTLRTSRTSQSSWTGSMQSDENTMTKSLQPESATTRRHDHRKRENRHRSYSEASRDEVTTRLSHSPKCKSNQTIPVTEGKQVSEVIHEAHGEREDEAISMASTLLQRQDHAAVYEHRTSLPSVSDRHKMFVRDISSPGKVITRVTRSTPVPESLQPSGRSCSARSSRCSSHSNLRAHPSMIRVDASRSRSTTRSIAKSLTESLHPQTFIPGLKHHQQQVSKSTSMLDAYNLSDSCRGKPRSESLSSARLPQRHGHHHSRSLHQRHHHDHYPIPQTPHQRVAKDKENCSTPKLTPNTVTLPLRHVIASSTRPHSCSHRCQAPPPISTIEIATPAAAVDTPDVTTKELGKSLFKKAFSLASRVVATPVVAHKTSNNYFRETYDQASERYEIPDVIEFIQFDPNTEHLPDDESFDDHIRQDFNSARRGYTAKGA